MSRHIQDYNALKQQLINGAKRYQTKAEQGTLGPGHHGQKGLNRAANLLLQLRALDSQAQDYNESILKLAYAVFSSSSSALQTIVTKGVLKGRYRAEIHAVDRTTTVSKDSLQSKNNVLTPEGLTACKEKYSQVDALFVSVNRSIENSDRPSVVKKLLKGEAELIYGLNKAGRAGFFAGAKKLSKQLERPIVTHSSDSTPVKAQIEMHTVRRDF